MPSSIVVTAGSASANAYVTLAVANQFHSDRPVVASYADWTKSSETDKAAAILLATRRLDALIEWAGSVVNFTQALLWPRAGLYYRNGDYVPHDVIPLDLQRATAEYARHLLVGEERTAGDAESREVEKLGLLANRHGLSSVQAGNYSITAGDRRVASPIPPEVYELFPRPWIHVSRAFSREVLRA